MERKTETVVLACGQGCENNLKTVEVADSHELSMHLNRCNDCLAFTTVVSVGVAKVCSNKRESGYLERA